MERLQEQIVDPIEAPQQEHVQLHTALQIVHVPVPRIQSSTSISSAPPSAALAPVTEKNAPTPARAVLDEWIAPMTFEGETPAERVMLRRDAHEASAEQAAQELPCWRNGEQGNGKLAHQKIKEGQTQKVSCGRCTSWHPPARGGIQIPGTVDEGAYHESILQNDCESILTKGYESILWMVIRPALQAARYEDLLCRQPDTCVHHGELRYGTMGLMKHHHCRPERFRSAGVLFVAHSAHLRR